MASQLLGESIALSIMFTMNDDGDQPGRLSPLLNDAGFSRKTVHTALNVTRTGLNFDAFSSFLPTSESKQKLSLTMLVLEWPQLDKNVILQKIRF